MGRSLPLQRGFLAAFVRRSWMLIAVLPSLLLATTASGLGWLLFTEHGLVWGVATLQRASAGSVRIEGAHGRLFGPLRVERLQVASAGNRYAMHGIELAWQPMSLLDRLLAIERLKVDRIELSLASAAAPAVPAVLQLPLAVRLDALEIGSIALEGDSGSLARELKAGFTSDGTTHRLDALTVRLDAGLLTGQGTLAAAAPFALQASAHLAGSGNPMPQLDARVAGTLTAIKLDVDGQGQGFSATAKADLRPFSSQRLAALRLTAHGLDPRLFAAAAPRASLMLDVDLKPQADGALAGHLRADNAAPAPLDRGGLPFAHAETHVVLHWETDPRRLRLDGLVLKVGAGGTASGRADLAWAGDTPWPQGDATLNLRQLDPATLYSTLRPARLAGRVDVSGNATAQQLKLTLTDAADPSRRLDAELARRGDLLTLSRLRLVQARAELAAAGELRLDAGRAWRFDGTLQGFDPAAFVAAPHANLNAEFAASGRYMPTLDGRLRFSFAPSRLAGQALGGRGDLSFAGMQQPADLLAANGKAHLRGALELRLGDSQLHARGGWGSATEQLRLDLKLPDPASHRELWPGMSAAVGAALDLSLAGTPQQHRLTATIGLPAGRRVELTAAGTLRVASPDWSNTAWQGTIDTLSLAGSLPLALRAPTSLAASRKHIVLGAAELDFADGRIMLAESTWQPDRWSSSGRFERIALRLGGTGKKSGPAPARASGEWALANRAGNAGSGALAGNLRATVPDLRGLGPAIFDNLTSAGALEIDAGIAGTLAAPQLSGQVRGTGLAVSLIDENIQLRDGELLLRFDRDQALVERLVFVAPHQPPARARRMASFPALQTPGQVSIGGELDLRQARARLTATLVRVPLAQRTERWVVASGTVELDQAGQRLRLGAQLRADAGYIAELASGRPTLADDIVVLGRAPAAGPAPRIESDIAFDLGEHFHLRAGGLAARLAGSLRVRGGDGPGAGRLAATGSIATHDATYEAYGQRLVVERGIVNFQGPLDDPGLNVLALRKGGAVEAGVVVTGTAQQPRVRLVSTPAVSDAEKLSWIVLGRAPDAGGTDSALLLAAAGAILGGQGDGVTARLAQAFGVDELALRQGNSGDPLAGQILVLGKRLSARTYLGFEQGLTAATGAVNLTHALTPRISIVTRAGQDSAIDVFYHFAFD